MQNNRNLLIEFSPLFKSKLTKLAPDIVIAFKETIDLFLENAQHNRLRRHFLKKDYAGYESIDVSDDYRALFIEIKTETQVIIKFRLIGTHEELYGKK